jgi:hypothetical protein
MRTFLLVLMCSFSVLCEAATKPGAYVYAPNTINHTDYKQSEIVGYSISPSGAISKIPGGPFGVGNAGGNPLFLAANGKYVFATDIFGQKITTYKIESDGALTLKQVIDAAALAEPQSSPFGPPVLYGPLVLDHTGQNLYTSVQVAGGSAHLGFRVNETNGSLEFTGQGDDGVAQGNGTAMVFSGNNKFAYDSFASGFAVATNGELIPLSLPSITYNAGPVAADPYNNLAVFETHDIPGQLGSYQINAQGSVSTTGTAENRPSTHIQSVFPLNMSPSGKLLAIGGEYGLEIYHFNGTKPITPFHTLLSTTENVNNSTVLALGWDNDNHLYAFAQAGLSDTTYMRVYTATPDEVEEAKGSPFAMTGAVYSPGVVVQSLTK